MSLITIVITIAILIFSVVLHEVSHGLMAYRLGDPTPRMQGRLTLNPLKHLDPVGSVLVPLITSLAGFTFGWAKPVEYNPYNLHNRRTGEFLIAAAGPASNILIALIFGLALRFIDVGQAYFEVAAFIVIINITLAVFNLMPFPPLDGSKLLLPLLPQQYGHLRMTLERLGPIFVLLAIFFVWRIVWPIVPYIFKLITGIAV